jgi:hypothetical protein
VTPCSLVEIESVSTEDAVSFFRIATLESGAIDSSETSVHFHQTTLNRIPEGVFIGTTARTSNRISLGLKQPNIFLSTTQAPVKLVTGIVPSGKAATAWR